MISKEEKLFFRQSGTAAFAIPEEEEGRQNSFPGDDEKWPERSAEKEAR